MPCFETVKNYTELIYFLTAPVLVFFAWRMLEQLKIGSSQVKAAAEQIITAKKISEINTKRESMKIAAEQSRYFAKEIIPEINKFLKQKYQQKFPILLKATVTVNGTHIECKSDNFPGLLEEVYSDSGSCIETLNRIESFSMFFACGVADADVAYRPICTAFCDFVKIFLPFLTVVNERHNQFSNTIHLYMAWSMRKHFEQTEKEISKHKEHLSKIKIPEMKTFGTDLNC